MRDTPRARPSRQEPAAAPRTPASRSRASACATLPIRARTERSPIGAWMAAASNEDQIEAEEPAIAMGARQNLACGQPAADGVDDRDEMNRDRETQGRLRCRAGPDIQNRVHRQRFHARAEVARFSPAIEKVGESAFGQNSVQLIWLWHEWQPASPDTACKAFILAAVADVVDKGPGAVERGRAEIVLVPGNDVAGRIADAAIDAFDACIGRLTLGRAQVPRSRNPRADSRRARNSRARCAIYRRTAPYRPQDPSQSAGCAAAPA